MSGRPLTTDQLIGAVWPDDPPDQARKTVQVYVSKLRRHLGGADGSLQTVANGYRLATETIGIDALDFERLVDDAAALVTAQPDQAADRYRQALGLWTGTAYADVPEAEPMRAERTRLSELRLDALERRIDAELRLGLHRELIGELEALTIEHPYRERFVAQLMLALYRSGRQADALRVFRRAGRMLADELGIEPAPELRELEYRILNHDSALDHVWDRPTRDERAAMLTSPAKHHERPGPITSLRGYELREQLATSDDGAVYRAYQASVGREVVVKVIRPERANASEFVRHFEVAAQVVAQLEHPHIAALYDYWRDPGGAYLVMPWLGGGDLATALAAGPLATSTALRIVGQIGNALSYAHRQEVMHGAVIPANVLLDDEGNAYLSEFGIAGRAASASGQATDPTGERAEAPATGTSVTSSRTATAADDVVGLAAFAHELLTGTRPAPGASVTDERMLPELRSVLASALATDPEVRPPRVDDLVRALKQGAGVDSVGVTSAEPLPFANVRNPYKGLRAFQRIDTADFHGRDALVDRLVRTTLGHRLVAVVGPSGSGKSSLVRAGLLAQLEDRLAADGAASGGVLVTEMFPGGYPFEELETALLRVAVDRPNGMLADLSSDDRGLLRVVKQIAPDAHHQVLLVVDQFEELFSLVADTETQHLFLDALVTAVSDPRSPLRVVVTLRADFFDRPLEHAAFGELLQRGLVPVTAATRDELARAVSQPAALVGLDLEPGLTAEIVDDVIGQPGGLPLLQYALTELFQNRRSNTLNRADYHRIGGVTGALGARAEELYADLGPAAQEAARQVFLRLVTVDESADDVRRRVRMTDLSTLTSGASDSAGSGAVGHQTTVDRPALDAVIERYASHRLLSFDRDPVTRGPTVEVAHEALLREWDRLRSWIDGRRADLVVHRRFAAAVDDWERSDRDPSFLPQGGRLHQFEEGVADSQLRLTRSERDLLDASRAKRAADREREVRSARRLRRVLAAVTALAVVAVAAGIFARVQQTRAVDARFTAETRRLVSDAPIVAETNRQLGLLLAAEAYRRDTGPAALGALQRVLARTDGFLGYVGEGRSYTDAGWSADGRLVAGHDEGVAVIDTEAGSEVANIKIPAVSQVAVSPTDAIAVVLVTASPAAMLVDLDSGDVTELSLPPGSGDVTSPVMVAHFSPDGTRLALGTFAGDVVLLDVASGDVVWAHLAHPETDIPYETDAHEPLRSGLGVTHLVFSPDGTRLATAGLIFVRVWDLDGRAQAGADVEVFRTAARGERVPVAPLAIGLDDDPVVTVATQWGLSDWDARSGDLVREAPIPQSVGSVGSTAVDFDAHLTHDGAMLTAVGGRTIALSSEGETAREFQALVPGQGHLAIDPAGRRAAIAGAGRISLWSLAGHQLIATAVPVDPGVGGGEITSDGALMTVGSIDLQTRAVWDLSDDAPRLVADDIEAYVRPPDDHLWTIDIGGSDVTVQQLDRQTLRPVGPVFEAPTAWHIYGPVDGWLAISGGTADPVVRIFDPQTAELRAELTVDGAGAQVEARFEVSPDRRRLVVTTTDGASAVWDTRTWTQVAPLSAGAGQIVNTVYTPDGQRLLTLAADGTLSVRDATTFRRVGSPITTGTEIASGDAQLEISEDGRYLALGGHGVAQLWDLDTRTQIGRDFPDGGATVDEHVRHMLTTVGDHALVWDLDMDTWADVACTAAGRNMTPQEWAQFLPNDEYQATCAQWPALGGPSDGRSEP